MERSTESLALSLLYELQNGKDPVGQLFEHYQQNGIVTLKDAWREEKSPTYSISPLWSYTFTCPETMKTVSSSLPVDLVEAKTTTPLAIITRQLFGDYQVINGKVYFTKKKLAKRSCAFAALVHLRGDGQSDLLASSTTIQQSMSNDKINVAEVLTATANANTVGRKYFPEWVNKLHALGVRQIALSYEGEQTKGSVDWTPVPSKTFCRLTVLVPFVHTVTSMPCLSKQLALEHAVMMICDAKKKAECQPKHLSQLLHEKMVLLNSESNTCRYTLPVASWAAEEFVVNNRTGVEYHLYELRLLTSSFESFSVDCLKLDMKLDTRVGMLFPRHIEPAHYRQQKGKPSYDVLFQYQGKQLRAQLFPQSSNRILDLQTLRKLKQFNKGLAQWKKYGSGKEGQSQSFHSYAANSISVPNVLFVPLKLVDDGLDIDIATVDEQLNDVLTPILKAQPINLWQLIREKKAMAVFARFVAIIAFRHITSHIWNCSNILHLQTLLTFAIFTCFIKAVLYCQKRKQKQIYCSDARENMKNRFLLHTKYLYVLSKSNKYPAMFASSKMPCPNGKSITFSDYYLQRYGIKVCSNTHALNEAIKITKISSWNLQEDTSVHLIPELIKMLPLPRDFLLKVGMIERFMPELERSINVCLNTQTLIKCCLRRKEQIQYTVFRKLCRNLELATRMFPLSTYERLEFLGDAVLGYCLSLNVCLRNHALCWNANKLSEMVSCRNKNSVLFCKAQNISLHNLIYFCKRRWYKGCGEVCDKKDTGYVSDSQMSDVVESLIGALYISFDCSDTHIAEEFISSFIDLLYKRDINSETKLLLREGIQSGLSKAWLHLFDKLETDSTICPGVKEKLKCLSSNFTFFLCNPETLPYDCKILTSTLSKRMIMVALCHQTEKIVQTETQTKVKNFRDVLCVVGMNSLKFMISKTVFENDPGPPNNLHLLLNVVLADDVLAYITVKIFGKFLLGDISYEAITMFNQADIDGERTWKKHGGWILPGGVVEFRNRIRRLNWDIHYPCYPGIGGGRLYGRSTKLPQELTRDIAVSFKAIVGCLVLCLGANDTWKCIRPFLDELMLLSPEELRKYYPLSTLVASSSKE